MVALRKYCHKIKALTNSVEEWFVCYEDLETDFAIFTNPFAVNGGRLVTKLPNATNWVIVQQCSEI